MLIHPLTPATACIHVGEAGWHKEHTADPHTHTSPCPPPPPLPRCQVKVLDSSGQGSYSTIIQGLGWVKSHVQSNGNWPAVVSMSLGGPQVGWRVCHYLDGQLVVMLVGGSVDQLVGELVGQLAGKHWDPAADAYVWP